MPLVISSDAFVPSSFLLLVVIPGASGGEIQHFLEERRKDANIYAQTGCLSLP